MSAAANKKPWSMKWIVLAIILFVGAYTFLTLKYRKPGKAHEPYQDAKERLTTERLISAGYTQVSAQSERPAEVGRAKAAITGPLAQVQAAVGGLTPELKQILIDQPTLADDFAGVSAPAQATAMLPYPILFTCQLPDLKGLVGDTRVYIKENELVVVTNFERLDGELLSRTKEAAVLVTLPAGTFRAGERYQITLIGRNGSRRWNVQVN